MFSENKNKKFATKSKKTTFVSPAFGENFSGRGKKEIAAFLEEIRRIEAKWQQVWQTSQCFQPTIETNKPKFFVTVAYPYTSGPLHVGHARTYITGDIFARFYRLQGYNVLFPMAFHISGTPIEAIAYKIAKKDPQTMALYREYIKLYINDAQQIENILKSFEEPKNVANFFATHILKDFLSMGLSVDTTRQFTTGDPYYNKFVEWQFKKMYDQGYIVKGTHPVLWCDQHNNAVGEDDIASGDTKKVEVQSLMWYKIPIDTSKHVFAIVTPLSDNNNVSDPIELLVDLQSSFVVLRVGEERWIISKTAYDFIKFQYHDIKIIETITAAQLIERTISKSSPNPSLRMTTTNHVKNVFGSGIFNKPMDNTNQSSKSDIKQYETITVYYPSVLNARCRCGGNVVVAIVPNQYFIDYGNEEWKRQARQALAAMEIYPKKYRTSFEKAIEWVEKRPCVRKRGLGTKFPYITDENWIIESLSDSTIYMSFYTIVNLLNKYQIAAEHLTPDVFDYVFLGKGDGKFIAQKTKIDQDILEEMRRHFTYWYPNDLRHTGTPHISNHLIFAIFHHVCIFPRKYWLPKFTLNALLIRDGEKMSKSKGNVIPLVEVPQKYSADLIRLYYASATNLEGTINWKETAIDQLVKKFQHFWQICNDVITYTTAHEEYEASEMQWSLNSQIFFARIHSNLYKAFTAMMEYDIREYATTAFFKILNIIDDFLQSSRLIEKNNEAQIAIKKILPKWLLLLTPIIPHVCEELHQKMGFHGLISTKVAHFTPPSEKEIQMIQRYEFVAMMIQTIRSLKKVLKRKQINAIYIYLSDKSQKPAKKYQIIPFEIQASTLHAFSPIIAKTFNAKKVGIYTSEFKENIYDPQNRMQTATLERPGIYLE